jgi:hypothetical protein
MLQSSRSARHLICRVDAARRPILIMSRGKAEDAYGFDWSLDHMRGGNLGDDATQTAVIHNIKRRWPDSCNLWVLHEPSDTQTRHGIPSYPDVRFECSVETFRSLVSNSAAIKSRMAEMLACYKGQLSIQFND